MQTVRNVYLIALSVALLAVVGQDETLPPPQTATAEGAIFELEDVTVTDGDTIRADINFDWGASLNDQSIRLYGFDAWESKRFRRTVEITDEEIEKGKEATLVLEAMLEDGAFYLESPPIRRTRDPYGRVLGILWVEKEGQLFNVGDEMTRLGYARRDQE